MSPGDDEMTTADQPLPEGGSLRLANEFDTIYLRVVVVGNGHRVQVSNARTGASALLDATVLAALTELPPTETHKIVTAAVENEQ